MGALQWVILPQLGVHAGRPEPSWGAQLHFRRSAAHTRGWTQVCTHESILVLSIQEAARLGV
jgi:hypothetical protein